MDPDSILNLVALAANLFTAGTAAVGISLWRKQVKATNRQEIVTELLALVIEIGDVLPALVRDARRDFPADQPPGTGEIQPTYEQRHPLQLAHIHSRFSILVFKLRQKDAPDPTRARAMMELVDEFRVAYANHVDSVLLGVGPDAESLPKDLGWDWSELLKEKGPDYENFKKYLEERVAAFREWAEVQVGG